MMSRSKGNKLREGVGSFVRLRSKASKPSQTAAEQRVLAPSLEGEDVEGTVVFKRKAKYSKPSFA